MTGYGKSLLLDIHDCDVKRFTRYFITVYFKDLCGVLGARQEDIHFWDDVGVPEAEKQTDPRLVGTSAVQFILTSGITLHALDLLGRIYVDVFSCEDFDTEEVVMLTAHFFKGTVTSAHVKERD